MVLPVPEVRAPVDIDAGGNQFLERALLGLQQPVHVPDLEFHALAIVVAPDFFSRGHGLIPLADGPLFAWRLLVECLAVFPCG